MTIRVGILGLGMMGKCHFDTYAKLDGVQVEAMCDVDQVKRTGVVGNGMGTIDTIALRVYQHATDLIHDPEIDVIDITLPTYLHAKYTIAALEAGKHVICEKPMARTSNEAKAMLEAAQQSNKRLFLAHCIRFWPAYAKAREIVLSEKYGKVISARFCRIGAHPSWSWNNWLHIPAKSGLCALDLHIHDVDFIQYLFGKPKSVSSQGCKLGRSGIDHIFTRYNYAPGQFITAEGAWEYAQGHKFSMTFSICMEEGTLAMGDDLALNLYPQHGKEREVKLPSGDGYEHELKHFLQCMRKDVDSDIIPSESAMHSIKLVEAELESIRTNKTIPVRF